MQKSPETLSLLAKLHSTLAGLMAGAKFSEVALQDEGLPVVIMLHQNLLIAFAIGEQVDYLPLYEAFKKHYLRNSADWSAKDVAFVFCLPNSVSVAPSFCSQVEVDVYFCRKYVIQLGENLALSLARLPFLPLLPITPGVQTRPPSARTLLLQRNLSANLAKALVVPVTTSATKILSNCLVGTYGSPEELLLEEGPSSIADVREDRAQTILKSISIKNFRAYRTEQVFELGKAVTILYGPNGFGKTSFFDALDFAVTGGVGRLAKAPSGLVRVAKHLDGQSDLTEVSLEIEREGETHVIKRNLDDHNSALVDGKVTSRKEVLSLLTGGTGPGADRVDSLVDLFRATHLFSQESQELTQDVAAKCELSSELVSRMLAFEDYASGLKKTEEVLKLAEQEYSKAILDIRNAKLIIASEQEELGRLETLAGSDTSPDMLNDRYAALVEAVTTAGFPISGIAHRDTRGMRAMLEANASELSAQRSVALKAIEQLEQLNSLRVQLESKRAQMIEQQAQLLQVELHEKAVSERIGSLSSQLAQLKTQEEGFQLRRDWLNWAVSVHPEYEQLTCRAQNLTAELTVLSASVRQQRDVLEQAKAVQSEAAVSFQLIETAQKAATERRIRFQLVKDAAEAWDQATPTLLQLKDTEANFQASLEGLRKQFGEEQRAELSQKLLVEKAELELMEARSSDSKLKELIAELRGHVDGPNCQLCGHDHGSREDLLAAIDKRVQYGDAFVRLSEVAAMQRATFQTLMGRRQALATRIEQEELQLTQTQVQRAKLEQQCANYEALLGSIGLSLTSETPQQIQTLNTQIHVDELKAAGKVSSARQLLEAAEVKLASTMAAYQTLDEQKQAAESKLNDAQNRLGELQDLANTGAIDLVSSIQDLSKEKLYIESQQVATSAVAESVNTEIDNQKAILAAANVTVSSARDSYQHMSQNLTQSQARIQWILSELEAARFDSTISPDELLQQVKATSAREALALSLRDRVAKLEVAIDIAATSAAFESIRKRIMDHEAVVKKAAAHAEKTKPWIKFFSEVKRLLSTQQAFATNHFITAYGPRTAVIQQRLRPVYGFSEIEVSSRDSAIGIRVHRKGELLRPTDYFSQSQVQTLVLGLFLTACSSQTWSGFSSIMMDDPVTHFDDLNTYALLDLILGLQSSPEGDRQFVISTCDEKLLQLARHKFRHMGSAAKFYRFQAIGTEGPVVSEITA